MKNATYSNMESTSTQEHVFVSILNYCWTRWTMDINEKEHKTTKIDFPIINLLEKN